MAKYPRMVNRLFWYENEDGSGMVRNKRGEDHHLDRTLFQFWKRMDGKHDPYTVMPELEKEDVVLLLYMLENGGLLRRRGLWRRWAAST